MYYCALFHKYRDGKHIVYFVAERVEEKGSSFADGMAVGLGVGLFVVVIVIIIFIVIIVAIIRSRRPPPSPR